MSSNEQELTVQLRTLFGDEPEKNPLFRELAKKLAKEESVKQRSLAPKTHVSNSPVTQYTEVERIFHCTHCGNEFSDTIVLRKGETAPITNAEGGVTILNSKSPAIVHAYTGLCSKCAAFVETLSREELEDRYLSLLALHPFPHIHGYGQKLNIGEEERKELKQCIDEKQQ